MNLTIEAESQDWRQIADRLYASLKSFPCRCQMAVGARWHCRAQTVVAQQCSRCVALGEYELATGPTEAAA